MKKARQYIPPPLWRFIYLIVQTGLVILGVLAWVILSFLSLTHLLTIVVGVIIGLWILATLSGFVFWRCPVCDDSLNYIGMPLVEYCSTCGSDINSEIL